ncbi:MAG: hypothetical protein ACE5KG_04990 [Nitrososphaerales archaeon]
MKKEYVVVEIAAAQDGGPFVFISLTDPREVRESFQPQTSPPSFAISSMDDLMKGLNKAVGGITKQMSGRFMTTIKMDIKEYEESGLKVGDKINLDIVKVQEGT